MERKLKKTVGFSLSNLSIRQPSPVIWISPPRVRMLNRKCKTIVNSSNFNACRSSLFVIRSCFGFLVVDEPVIVASVSVPDDVIKNHQPLKLLLKIRRM